MLNSKFFQKLKQDHDAYEAERKAIISQSNIVLHDSKRVIFSLHRGDDKKAGESLREVERILIKLEEKYNSKRLYQEGSFRAGVEEYVEAKMFFLVVHDQKINKFEKIKISYDSYLSGICDLTGELVRYAINKAASKDYPKVKKARDLISDIMAEVVEFDMTGYLRTKYDQARGNLRKIEQISYEIRKEE